MDKRVGWGLPGGTASGHYIDFGVAVCDRMRKTGIVSTVLPIPEWACLECVSLLKATGGQWIHSHTFDESEGSAVGCRCGEALASV
jgi:hypothetical protein